MGFTGLKSTENRRYDEAHLILERIKKPKNLQPLTATLQFHVLLGKLKWDEAYWIYRTHNQVGDDDLIHFMEKEIIDSRLTNDQQLELLDRFYPQISEKLSSRNPASLKEIPKEIREIYRWVEEKL